MNNEFEVSWIWLNPVKYPDHQRTRISQFDRGNYSGGMAIFRREFDLQNLKHETVARISGDCKYRIKVNGVIVGDGPPEVGGDYDNKQAPDWWFFDTLNFSSFLHVGKNIIEAEVMLDGECQADYSTGQGGFLLELKDENEKILLKSDSSWLCRLNPAWRPRSYDARLEPDDTEWTNAVVLSGENWNLKELNLPPLRIVEESPLQKEELPITVQPGVPKVIHLSFEREIAANFAMSLTGSNGASITIEYAEVPGVYHHNEVYHLKDGKQYFRSTRMNAFKYVKLTIRCGDFGSPTYEPVQFLEFSAFSRGLPVSSYQTVTSDNSLNDIRKCCDATLRMCMQRLHLDSPVHQEGLGCTGDYMIESLMSYYLFGEYRLAAADIRRTAYLLEQKQGVMFHTSYSLMWVEMVRDYLYYSGDIELVREVFPQIRLLLNVFSGYVGRTGLISAAPNYMFVDWVNDGKYNYHHPPASRGMGALTAWYYKALKSGVELAGICAESAEQWSEQAEVLKKSFNCELWDEVRKLYKDGVPGISQQTPDGCFLPEEDGQVSFTMHTNILALALGLVPEIEVERLLKHVMEYDWPIKPQPYFFHFVFEALHVNGAFENYAADLLPMWTTLVEEHPDGLKECWNCGDYSHAWGGTPAYQIGRSILGVTPLKPGFKSVLIAPCIIGLEYAQGEIPTPIGVIDIKWSLIDDIFTLDVVLPEGMEHELHLPELGSSVTPLATVNYKPK